MSSQAPPTFFEGQHVAVGPSRNVWRVESVDDDGRVHVARVNRAIESKRPVSFRSFPGHLLQVTGVHQDRTSTTEQPETCDECGCYREVKRRG